MGKRLSIVGSILLCFSLLGCTSHHALESLKMELQQVQSLRRLLPLPPGLYDYRGAVHVHSFLSHDSQGTKEEIVQAAKIAGLHFVVMTDHQNPDIFKKRFGGIHDGILVIQGMEISLPSCSRRPCTSLLAIGLSSYFDPSALSLKETLDTIRQQGAITFVAHPRQEDALDLDTITGMEIYDVLDDVLDKKWFYPKLFFDILYSHKKYAEQVFLSIQDYPEAHLALWDRLQKRRKIVGIAGNDAHQNTRVLGRQLDPYATSFRFVSTHLLADTLSETSLLAALQSGHAYVAFDLLADPAGFLFSATSDGKEAIMGESIDFTPGQTLTVQSPQEGLIALIKDGKQIFQCRCAFLTYPVAGPGVYRAEVFLQIQHRRRPWIFSNPLYIR